MFVLLLMIVDCGADAAAGPEGEDLGAAGGSNVEAAEHDFVIDDLGDPEVVFAYPGESSTGTVDLEPGTNRDCPTSG